MKNKNKSSTIFTPGVLAVFLMIFSGFFATTMHCLIRFATEDHHPFEVAFFRTIFVLVIFFPFVAKKDWFHLSQIMPNFKPIGL